MFSHIIYPNHSFSYLPSSVPSHSFSPRKKTGLQEKSTKYDKIKYNKIKQATPHQDWARPTQQKGKSPRVRIRIIDPLIHTLGSHIKIINWKLYCIYGGSVQDLYRSYACWKAN